MAQRSNPRKRAPAYSGDTLALRAMAGLALTALGVVIFLAVEMRMTGNVFSSVRTVCYGLAGGLALALPFLFVWAGVLVFWSTQRKAPARPFLYACLAFLGVCAFIVLVTRYGNTTLLAHLTGSSRRGWGDVIRTGYAFFAERGERGAAGGSIGVLLGWPLSQLIGDIPAAAIWLLEAVFCLLLALNLTPSRIRDIATGKASFLRRRQAEERERANGEQIAWQQEQARRQAWQVGQPQAQNWPQGQPQAQNWPQGQPQGTGWPQGQPQGTGVRQPAQPGAWSGTSAGGRIPDPQYTGSRMPQAPEDTGVSAWQEQLTGRMATAGKQGHRSWILGRDRKESGQAENAPFLSRIFGRREEDGLSDVPAARRRPVEVPEEAPGRNPRGPETRWNAADQDEEVQEIYNEARRKNREVRKPPVQPAEEEKEEAWRSGRPGGSAARVRPAEPAEEETEETGRSGRPGGAAAQVRLTKSPEEEETPSGGRKPVSKSSWALQVEEAQKKAGGDPEEASGRDEKTPAEGRPSREPKAGPGEVKVPVAQPIGEAAYKPELKNVTPRTEEDEEEAPWTPTPYYAPPITDLRKPQPNLENTEGEDRIRSARLEETLASFRVQAHVASVTHGPAISRFELELASGTKVNKVAELEKDIAYGMEATSVRIEAPIPGKSLVGVEVPNRKVSTVTLREVLESPAMQNAKSILTVALGKDIAGTPVVCDLARMPHMLIAGATGSGKSVCINAIINSLLYRAGPEEVRLILVDPKVVELQVYNGIPHLLIPVVNDPHKASAALAWAVAEMMERYDTFAKAKVRNLDGYNNSLGPGEKPMPRIVIIIDELADLMMVCKKDVEEHICRLTQLARAAGIHLIVATQRPSVDVITGLIKANIPSRIAFKTASSVDSRTILDRNGSEQLLGLGDMLYLPTGSFAPTRIQGCFLSDEEVNKITTDVKQANPSTYDPDILDKLEQMNSESGEAPGMDLIGGPADNVTADSGLFEQAVEYAIADGQISTSTLQRRLKVGYARAGRLTDEMEERGIISAKDGSKPRKCLVTREQWEEMKKSTGG